MKRPKALAAGAALLLSACLNNPTIDEEIARKCGISIKGYQKAEGALNAGQDGMSVRAGRCRFTRTSEGVIEGVVTEGWR